MFAMCASFFGCTTGMTDLGYELAQEKKFTKAYSFDFNSPELTKAVLLALQDREWKVTSTSSPITASLKYRDCDAKLKITVQDKLVTFNSEGTTLAGEKFVPLRYIDFLKKSIEKHLREFKTDAVVKEAKQS